MSATLVSNSGTAGLTLDLVEPATLDGEVGVIAEVSISCEHCDGEHSHPVTLSACGLWLSLCQLSALADTLAQWVGQPLDELARSTLTSRFELARQAGQRLDLQFGPRSDTISEGKPILSVDLRAGRTCCESSLVTDQSCLRLFSEELTSSLRSFAV